MDDARSPIRRKRRARGKRRTAAAPRPGQPWTPVPSNSPFIDETLAYWQPFSRRPLTREDAREIIGQICARARELRQRRVEIAHLVSDMVHSRPPLREEASDRRVLAQRFEQLDAAFADPDRRCAYALILDRRAMFEPRTEQLLVSRESRVEVLDRDS